MAAAIVFIVAFLVTTAIHMYQVIRTHMWITIPFIIGGFCEWIGYIGRAAGANQSPDWTLGPYIVQTILLLVAPALFAASIYMLLSRIILLTDGETHSTIPKRWLTIIFVTGDVISFMMQGAGGGIMSGRTLKAMHLGENVIIGGLVVQLLFFGFFLVTSATFHMRMARRPTTKVVGEILPWKKHLYMLYSVSVLIFVLSLFRLVEYTQGYDGYLISHEVFLYIFDSLLMLSTMVIFVWIHPSEVTAYLQGNNGMAIRGVISLRPIV